MKSKLPINIHYKHGAYYYVIKRAGKVKWTRLGKTESEMYQKLAEIKSGVMNKNTMAAFFNRYKNEVLPSKAENTQKYFLPQLVRLNAVFGHIPANKVTSVMVYQYLDQRGLETQIQANREVALLSTIFNYCIRWGALKFNPCRDVKKFKEQTRDRYIEDWEYKAIYDAAKPLIQVTMEIAVITGMRQRDILNLRLSDLHDDGLHITTEKTGTKQIIKWTPDLKAVVKQAKALRKVTSSIYLICNQKGMPYTSSGFKSMWQKTMNKALHEKVIRERFTFRDLRPKAASDHEDGTKLLAHTDAKTTKKYYLRKAAVVTPSR